MVEVRIIGDPAYIRDGDTYYVVEGLSNVFMEDLPRPAFRLTFDRMNRKRIREHIEVTRSEMMDKLDRGAVVLTEEEYRVQTRFSPWVREAREAEKERKRRAVELERARRITDAIDNDGDWYW